jgi:uncharacterized protein
MTPGTGALLACAGFVAGGVNAVAGGGSLISFPALLATGIGSVPANVTNTVALWPGYVGGAAGYRQDLPRMKSELALLGCLSLGGVAVGAAILLNTPGRVFTSIVPWLVLLSTTLFVAQPLIAKALPSSENGPRLTRRPIGAAGAVGVFLASVYGGYFGAGVGVMLLAVLGLLMPDDLQRLNGMKNWLSLAISTVALIAFALFGPVDWLAVPIMATASLAGGYVGASVARRLHPTVLRICVGMLGFIVSVKLFAGS